MQPFGLIVICVDKLSTHRSRKKCPCIMKMMAPWLALPFGPGQVDKDLEEIRRCMPEAAKPIVWEDEASYTSHSIVNMMENCASATRKPSLTQRLRSMAHVRRRKPSSFGSDRARAVAFCAVVSEIPSAVTESCDDHSQGAALASTRPSLSTFLSAIPRQSSTSLLHGLPEEEDEEDSVGKDDFISDDEAEASICDSVLSATGTEPRSSRPGSLALEWNFGDEGGRTSRTCTPTPGTGSRLESSDHVDVVE